MLAIHSFEQQGGNIRGRGHLLGLRDRVSGECGGASEVVDGVGTSPAEDGDRSRGGWGEGPRRPEEHQEGGEASVCSSLSSYNV